MRVNGSATCGIDPPLQVSDDSVVHLRARLPLLDLADVQDPESTAGEPARPGLADVGDVQRAAVVGEPHAVVLHAELVEDRPRPARVGEVDRGEAGRGAGGVERLAVRGEAALVPEQARHVVDSRFGCRQSDFTS